VARPLWLCLYLPFLPLEALATRHTTAAFAVFEEHQRVRSVLLANKTAERAGIHPGRAVNAALALQPELQLEVRKPLREQRLLCQLAGWAERYTSFVTLDAPAVLLLEIAASLHLFGGIRRLRHAVLQGLEAQGFTALTAIAPTPLAATWLARAGDKRCIDTREKLAGSLGRLPLHCLRWPDAIIASLKGMGIGTIGDCLRLPRAGFARRFGAVRLEQLDRALGRLPDPRDSYRTPARFSCDCELDEEQSDSERLLAVCQQLLQKLERFLLTRQLAVQRLRFSFFHWQAEATHLTLGCVQAERSTGQWMDLLRIRFEHLDLSAPVIAIRLRAGHSQALTATSAALGFADDAQGRQRTSMAQLVERLSARMGEEAVHGITAVAEHRPDYAWQARRVPDETPHCQAAPNPWYEQRAPQLLADMRRTSSLLLQRPLWMLKKPERLACHELKPCHHGVLTLREGPERIETGWWDEAGIARDYYVAENPAGVHLWVFCNRDKAGGWYLHGIFG
jgi:protein ImuB